MIEKIVSDYLKSNGIKVYMEESDRPEEVTEYVVLEKTGGGGNSYLKNSTIALKSYATSLYNTALLNEKLKALMEKIVELDVITRCELNSDYEYNDTIRKKYRYQAVFDIYHY